MGTLAQTIAKQAISNGIMSIQTKYLAYMFQQQFWQTWKYFCLVNRKTKRIVGTDHVNLLVLLLPDVRMPDKFIGKRMTNTTPFKQ